MSIQSISLKGILLVSLSVLCTIGVASYAGAATSSGSTAKTVVKKTPKTTISCTGGSELNTKTKKCNVCQVGSVSTGGPACRACRGDNIASEKGALACTPCPTGTKANKAHNACIKQRYVSGERK